MSYTPTTAMRTRNAKVFMIERYVSSGNPKMKLAQAFLRGDHREYTMSTRTCSS